VTEVARASVSIFAHLLRSLRIVGPKVRRKMVLFSLILPVSALLELIGISLIFPIAAVLAGERSGISGKALLVIESWTGFNDPIVLAISGSTILIIILFFKAVFTLSMSHLTNRSLILDETKFIIRLYSAYLFAPKSFHDRRNTAEIIQNMVTNPVQLYRNTCLYVLQTVSDMVVSAGILVVLIVADPIAALSSTLVLAVVGTIFVRVLAGPTHRMAREMHDIAVASSQVLRESLEALLELQALGRQGFFIDTYFKARRRLASIAYWQQTMVQAPRYVFEIFVGIMVLVVIVALAGRRSSAEILGVLAVYGVAAIRVVPAATRIVGMVTTLRAAIPGVLRLEEDLRELNIYQNHEDLHSTTIRPSGKSVHFADKMELRGVGHRYENGAVVLRDIDLVISRGQSVGLVGVSGAGKSTLAQILLGLIEPAQGCVLFDGRPITYGESAASRSMGYVPQQIFVFDTTLKRNVAVGIDDDDIDEERVNSVLRDAQLEEYVDRLQDGVESRLGEHGGRVSGGQRQRIGIARALYNDPEILLLDEATSSLDVETEARFADVVTSLRRRKTLIIIAHRLSTIRACDRLIFLKDGRIIGDGPFDELLRTSVEFARLVATAGITIDQPEPSAGSSADAC
jgi:ATP-binding cassette subfamily C protein